MSSLAKDTDLIQFVKARKQLEIDVEQGEIFRQFIKLISNTYMTSLTKLKEMEYCTSCVDTMYLIFWSILSYSKNLKLTSFLCERAIILFHEYVNMSLNNKISNTVDLSEIKHFVYKKSLGPLLVQDFKKEHSLEQIHRNFARVVYDAYTLFFTLHLVSVQKIKPSLHAVGGVFEDSPEYFDTQNHDAGSLETYFQFLDELFNDYLGKILGSPRMVSDLRHLLADPHIYKERIPDIQDKFNHLVCGPIGD